VTLVRALCTCNDEPMLNNQNLVSKMLFENEQIVNKIIYPVSIQKKDIVINIDNKEISLDCFK